LQAEWSFLPEPNIQVSANWQEHPLTQLHVLPPTKAIEYHPWWGPFSLDARIWHTTNLNEPTPESPDEGFGIGLFANLPLRTKTTSSKKLRKQIITETSSIRTHFEIKQLQRNYENIKRTLHSAQKRLENAKDALAVQYAICSADSNRFLNAGFGDVETMLSVYKDLDGREMEVAYARKQLHLAKVEALFFVGDSNTHSKPDVGIAVYAWNGSLWFKNTDSLVHEAKRRGIGRIALSLGPQELRGGFPAQAWNHIQRALSSEGIELELLLGEPTWIIPANRQNLIALIANAQKQGVTSIHLDIEPEQLLTLPSPPPPETLLAYFSGTLDDVRKQFPPPLRITVSLHHRYFSSPELTAFANRLDAIGIDEFVLMAYMDRPEKILERLSHSLALATTHTKKSIAISVERNINRENRLQIAPHTAAQKLKPMQPSFLFVQSLEEWIAQSEVSQ